MRKELYSKSKLIEVEEILEKEGKIVFKKYDGKNNLLESREATEKEKQMYEQEQIDIQREKEREKIMILANKSGNLTTSEIQEALKLLLKYLKQ